MLQTRSLTNKQQGRQTDKPRNLSKMNFPENEKPNFRKYEFWQKSNFREDEKKIESAKIENPNPNLIQNPTQSPFYPGRL